MLKQTFLTILLVFFGLLIFNCLFVMGQIGNCRAELKSQTNQFLLHISWEENWVVPLCVWRTILLSCRHTRAGSHLLLTICSRPNAICIWVWIRHNFRRSLTVETFFLLTLRWGQYLWFLNQHFFFLLIPEMPSKVFSVLLQTWRWGHFIRPSALVFVYIKPSNNQRLVVYFMK